MLRSLPNAVFLLQCTSKHCREFHTSLVSQRYKKKWVEMRRKKVLPRELALAYFDTYYPNIYGEKCWEDMRLALLKRKKKYGALVNNFANSEQTVAEMIADHQAYDMFTIGGKKLKVPYSPPQALEHSPESDSPDAEPARSRWEEMAVDMGDATPDAVEYIESPEGFMVIKPRDDDVTPKHYHAPDLYDYIPAERNVTEQQQQHADLERQTLMLGIDTAVDIVAAEPMMVPPMLKCHIHESGVAKHFYSPKQDETNMLNYYLLDGASILPVLALDIKPHDRILDVCAAPGGKSLAIAQCLLADQIVCVDSSWSRLNRLKDTFRWYVPGVFNNDEGADQSVIVLQEDGRVMGDLHPGRYDKVLVDVPCNTDRECLNDDENSRFKRSRVTERLQLPHVQSELLISGIKACRPGGVIVYSTCTLTPGQNDYVVEDAVTRLGKDNPDITVVVQDTSSIADRLGHVFKFWPGSRYGQVVLPSPEANFGPTYFAKLLRVK